MTRRRSALVVLALGAGILWRVPSCAPPSSDGGAVVHQEEASDAPSAVRLAGRKGICAASTPEPDATWRPSPSPPPPPTHNVHATVVGWVVDTEGRGVPGADVAIPDLPFGPHKTTTDDAGRYRLHVPWKGAHEVDARADGVGTGSATSVGVWRDGETQAPPIVLRGPGRVEGVVRFPDGTPADGVQVETEIDLQRGGSWKGSPDPGLIRCRSYTDRNGRFVAAGLRPGPYRVEAPVTGAFDGHASVPARDGQRDVRLVIPVHRTRFRIRDENGRSLPDANVDDVYVQGTSWHYYTPHFRRPQAELETWGVPGTRHIVIASAEGRRARECVVTVPETPWSQDVEVVLPRDDGACGRVGIRMQRLDGSRIHDLTLRARTASGTYRMPGYERISGAPHDVFELPPGRYRLDVSPPESMDDDHVGYDFSARTHVTVVAGERVDLSVTSRQGGRVRVHTRRGEGLDPEEEHDVNYGLVVHPDADPELGLDYENVGWFVGESILGPLVEAGPWHLEVEGNGVEEQLLEVQVVAGRTLDVHVTLLPDSTPEEATE